MRHDRDWLMVCAAFVGPAVAVGLAVWGWGGTVTAKLDDLRGALQVEVQARTDSTAALTAQVAQMQGDVTSLRTGETAIDHRLASVEAAVYPALQPQVVRRR